MQHNAPVNATDANGTQSKPTTSAALATTSTSVEGAGTRIGATATTATTATTTTATNPSTSSSPISSYASWTVPSLENLYLARRASALGARYGLLSPRSSTPVPSKPSPAPSVMSVMMEGGTHGVSIQNKARKMSLRMSDSITSALNDSSLVLYRVNEHIHKKVPQFVEEKKALVVIHKNVETANQDLEDARQTISGMQRITELGAIEELVKRALAAVQSK